MAIFNSALFEHLRQSIDNVVLYESRGQNVMRSKLIKIRNPRTPEQTKHRSCFGEASALTGLLYPVAVMGFPAVYPTQSRGAFVSVNIPILKSGEDPKAMDFSRLICSRGKLTKPIVEAVVEDSRSLRITSFPQPLSAHAAREDRVVVVFLETVEKDAIFFIHATRGVKTEEIYGLPDEWKLENVFVYAFATDQAGKKASDTLWVSL